MPRSALRLWRIYLCIYIVFIHTIIYETVHVCYWVRIRQRKTDKILYRRTTKSQVNQVRQSASLSFIYCIFSCCWVLHKKRETERENKKKHITRANNKREKEREEKDAGCSFATHANAKLIWREERVKEERGKKDNCLCVYIYLHYYVGESRMRGGQKISRGGDVVKKKKKKMGGLVERSAWECYHLRRKRE